MSDNQNRLDRFGSKDSPSERSVKAPNRRAFLGQMGAAATIATTALASPSAASTQHDNSPRPEGLPAPPGVNNRRIIESFEVRVNAALRDASLPAAKNVTNGDEGRYPDKAGTYTKGLPHDAFGRVDLNAFHTFKTALNSGKPADFGRIIMGGTRTLNGPQGGLKFDLECADAVQFGQPQVPPAPATASDQNATELLEHYWGALLRDVPFADYGSNPLAAQAASELGAQPTYLGPREAGGQVSTNLLFRGAFPGETAG